MCSVVYVTGAQLWAVRGARAHHFWRKRGRFAPSSFPQTGVSPGSRGMDVRAHFTTAPPSPQLPYISKQEELRLVSQEHPVTDTAAQGRSTFTWAHPNDSEARMAAPGPWHSVLPQNLVVGLLAASLCSPYVWKGLGLLDGVLRLLSPLLKCTAERINLHQKRKFSKDWGMWSFWENLSFKSNQIKVTSKYCL